ncbi:AbrB/MazE/SpoVT family DNA-binding domain-containing protein [Alkalimonas mucilaginosa]|uniref:AbrB/MazE/SpoVT family DNA-binding domain-containing protein n=1 Tax=Alkalimonas mucilaginosa TaxID=3057676 RepID=A0ABU7JKW8_9GAMM|nr:AbrB/MazE/SpoVT family DNA-binding domain-containing protein [Alkalimonas sp. MEB004]MEE2025613.1 AbrB/MazE/SpoVT family DNA-binding domain-containing protein [Alkalimonas sp. MEB004]
METTKLSSKGQVIIPKHIRQSHHWESGLELQVIEQDGGVLLKPKAPFTPTTLTEVAGSLPYSGSRKTNAEIETAMKQAARKAWRDSN